MNNIEKMPDWLPGMKEKENEPFKITYGELWVLIRGLKVWNCEATNLLGEQGRKILFAAQDLAEKVWNRERT